jgi:hypothetical protein
MKISDLSIGSRLSMGFAVILAILILNTWRRHLPIARRGPVDARDDGTAAGQGAPDL